MTNRRVDLPTLLILGLLLAFLSSCSSSSDSRSTTTLSGNVTALISTVTPTQAQIEVLGRSDLRATAPLSGGTGTFTLAGVPVGESLVFQISGSDIVNSLTFPLGVVEAGSLELAFLDSDNRDNLTNNLEDLTGDTQTDGNGIIYGVISEGFRTTLADVRLINFSGGLATANGPFGLASNPSAPGGQELTPSVTAGSILANGTYVYFNVEPGNYRVLFIDSSNDTVSGPEFVVVADRISVGYLIP